MLVMEVGGTVYAQETIIYDGLACAREKMDRQERQAADMRQRFARDLCRYEGKAEFYVIGERSRGNALWSNQLNEIDHEF